MASQLIASVVVPLLWAVSIVLVISLQGLLSRLAHQKTKLDIAQRISKMEEEFERFYMEITDKIESSSSVIRDISDTCASCSDSRGRRTEKLSADYADLFQKYDSLQREFRSKMEMLLARQLKLLEVFGINVQDGTAKLVRKTAAVQKGEGDGATRDSPSAEG